MDDDIFYRSPDEARKALEAEYSDLVDKTKTPSNPPTGDTKSRICDRCGYRFYAHQAHLCKPETMKEKCPTCKGLKYLGSPGTRVVECPRCHGTGRWVPTPEQARKYEDRYDFDSKRELAIQRDGEKCVDCGMTREEHKRRYNKDITVDHIDRNGKNKPKGEKNNDLANLQTLCLVCHGRKDSTNRVKTECLNGHPFDEVNTYVGKGGMRTCKACSRIRSHERHLKKKEATK